jgi:hypothetical protein
VVVGDYSLVVLAAAVVRPARQVAAALTGRGIDLTDRYAVDNAIHQLNGEQLAQRLLP